MSFSIRKCEYNFLDLVLRYNGVSENSLIYADWLEEECGIDSISTIIRLKYCTPDKVINLNRGYDYRSQTYRIDLPDFKLYYQITIINKQCIFNYRFWLYGTPIKLWFSLYDESLDLFQRLCYQLGHVNTNVFKAIDLNERSKNRKART